MQSEGSVDPGLVEHLKQHGTAATDPPVVLHAGYEPVLARQIDDRWVEGLDLARVHHRGPDSLRDEAFSDLHRNRSHRPDADDQHIPGAVAKEDIHPA